MYRIRGSREDHQASEYGIVVISVRYSLAGRGCFLLLDATQRHIAPRKRSEHDRVSLRVLVHAQGQYLSSVLPNSGSGLLRIASASCRGQA